MDAAGNLYIADSYNNRIRKVTADGVISTIAGTGTSVLAGTAARPPPLNSPVPSGVAVDTAGNLYIADLGNFRVRKVTPGGLISTVARATPMQRRRLRPAGHCGRCGGQRLCRRLVLG